MNKEFMILSDGNLAVTDENGHISKRTYDNNAQEILLTENKIEIVNNKIEKLNKDLNEEKEVISVTKVMLIALPILLFLTTSGTVIYRGLSSPSIFLQYALYYAEEALFSGAIMLITAITYYNIVKLIHNKKINKIQSEIKISKKLKEDYEKELSDIKEKQSLIKPQTLFYNESISLIPKTNIIETQIEHQINKTYNESLNKKNKKLVLKRKK